MTYPILNMAQILRASPLNGDTRRFVRSSRLPKLADGPDVVAVIADGGNKPIARWVRNPQSRKLECIWSAASGGAQS